MVISGVTNLMAGATQVVRAYAGSTEVWSHVSQGFIYYKSTNNSVVTPNDNSGFGANIVSNTYNGGQGVITFDGAVTTIPLFAFSGKTTLSDITFPDTLETIGQQSFSGCTALTSVTIPDNVTTLATSSFRDCSSLASVYIGSGITNITGFTFRDCRALSSVTIAGNITQIGNAAFYTCTNLASINLPASLTTIGTNAFGNCSGLTTITIDTGITQIGDTAFSNCKNLVEIKYNGTKTGWTNVTKGTNWNSNVPSYGVYCSDGYDPWVTNSSKKIYYTTTSKSTITPRNIAAFNDTYSNSITSNSYNIRGTLEFYYDATTIPVNAFSGMTSLQSICIDNEGAKIRDYAFKDCTNLVAITYLGTKNNWNSKTKGTDWYLNTKATVVHCTDGDVSI